MHTGDIGSMIGRGLLFRHDTQKEGLTSTGLYRNRVYPDPFSDGFTTRRGVFVVFAFDRLAVICLPRFL